MRRRTAISAPVALLLLAAACAPQDAEPMADIGCFGSRVLSFQDLVAEVVIPTGEPCSEGTFTVVFTRGLDTLVTITERRTGSVGFLGTADVDGDGRGEFFVATRGTDVEARGHLHGYSDRGTSIERMTIAPLDSAQLTGYTGSDRFGLGGADQLVRAFPRASGDTAWFAYSHGEGKWTATSRPAWVR
jgi:hypothetical protein